MRRLIRAVFEWLFPMEWLKPSPPTPLPHGAGSKNNGRPLWVDAVLAGMKQEIGLVFLQYPRPAEIYACLPGISLDDAEWIWNACQFDDRVWALVTINDVARAVNGGVPITEIRTRGLVKMMAAPEWERKG